MKADTVFGDKVEYVQRLAGEVADLKGVLQDISQQVRRIERRIDLVLPEAVKAKRKPGAQASQEKPQTLSETQARRTIDRLTDELRNGKSIQAELRDMTMKHGLTPIARVLGMTNTALPPKTELVGRIITRLRQSVMLTENIRKYPRVAEDEKHFGD